MKRSLLNVSRVTVAIVGACSLLSSGVRPEAALSWSASNRVSSDSQSAKIPLMYVAEIISNDIAIFDRNGNRRGEILLPAQPHGILVDRSHHLWVTSGWTGSASTILEFARGGTTPIKTLSDAGSDPMDVTMCPNGTIYVTNGGNNNPGITVYAPGSLSPTAQLTYPGQTTYYYLTCDAAGNVFATIINNANRGAVIGYRGGLQSGVYDLGIRLPQPGGIKADNAGNLLAVDQDRDVTEYTEQGLRTGRSVKEATFSDIAISEDGSLIAGGIGGLASRVSVYAFPHGNLIRKYRDLDYPNDVAFDPGQRWAGPKDDAS